MVKSLQKCLIMLMSAVIAFACLFAFEAALPQYALTAYAASISAPSVKAENTSPTSVNLKWKKVKGAKKYVVYRSTKKNKDFKAIKTIKKSSTVSYTDKKLKAGSTYYYKVAAVNGKSKKSSKTVKIKAIPSAVKGIDGESKTCSTVTVVFNKQSGVSGYDIQYSATENGKYKTVSLQKGTSFNHTIGEGAIGFYRVRAYITVKGKKIYGGFSDIIGIEAYSHSYNQSVVEPTCIAGGYTLYTCSVCSSSYTTNPTPVTSHKFGSYIIDKDATCATTGSKHKTCSVCGFEQYKSIEATGEHSYGKYTVTTAPTCQQGGIETSKCSLCGKAKTREIAIVDHAYENYIYTTKPTCTENGEEVGTCKYCGKESKRIVAAIGHNIQELTDENGYIVNKCINCGEIYDKDTTCYIDLTSRTISVPSVASFTVSASGNDKLELYYDGITSFELTGEATNLSIDVNATADCEVKLAGVTITNTDLDIINIKDKSPNEADEAAATGSVALDVIPVVAISAKVDTVNTLTTKAGELVKGGKIIDSDCRLELKGRGTVNMDTTATAVSSMDPTDPNYPASTAIRNSEKIYIKNLTLDIKSANRGIDTKKDFKDAQGNVYDTEFYNIELSGNAKITITSTDDGIRCKNFDSNYLAVDEVDSTVTINAGGDGIQLEGKSTNRKASMILHSGTFNINGTKSIINNKSMKVPVADGTATANFATIPPSMAQ